jgi:chromosome segregation ATPase
MDGIENQLKDLQTELGEYEAEIVSTQETLQDAQKKISDANRRRNELATKIAALKKEFDEIQASQAAIENERKTAESDISDAKKVSDEVMTQLKDKISADRPKSIEDAVKAVDDDIEDKKKAVDEARSKLTEAEKAVADVQSQVSVHEQAAGQIKGLLKSLPNQIRTARGRIASLKSIVSATAQREQINDTLYLVQELGRAVDGLRQLVDPKHIEGLLQQLTTHQQEATAGKDDVAQKTAACEQLRSDLAAAERDYQNKVKTREGAIKATLAALPEGQDEPTTVADGRSAYADEEQSAKPTC